MKFDNIKEILNKIVEQYNFGLLKEVTKVVGGLTHTTYKIKTSKGIYIIKLLNPNIMKRKTALYNFKIADELELKLIENEIKVLQALKFNEKSLLKIDEQYLYIFDFFDGKSLTSEEIKEEHCELIALELSKIHNIDIKNENYIRKEIKVDWNYYLDLAKEKNSNIYNMLINKIDVLNKSMNVGNEAIKNVPNIISICHNDMDSKNILWNNKEFKIIDLECLSYSNPYIEFFQLALCWSGYEMCNINYDLLKSFIKTYLNNVNLDNIDWEVIYNSNYGRLEWLEFNLKRSFMIECDSKEEQLIGINEVKETLEHVIYYDKIKDELLSAFKNYNVNI